jgi:hypothetical protein
MSAYPAKAIVVGLMGMAFCAVSAPALAASDYATLQAAAERARAEARTAQAEQPQAAPAAQNESGEAQQQSGKGLTESQVRVMLGLTWSVVPDVYQDPEGREIKVDKENPNRYLIPVDDARRIIRAASRTAYAQICNLQDHQTSNYQAMMALERSQKNWSTDQLMFINTLHLFAVGQMTGNVTLVDEVETPADAKPQGEAPAAEPAPPAPVRAGAGCPPQQKEKVQTAIDAYVAAVEKETAAKATP